MSGGSLNYIYAQIAEYADCLRDKELVELAKDMANLFYEAEWWQSGDTSEGDYRKAIAEFKDKWFKSSREERLIHYIDLTASQMTNELKSMIDYKQRCEKCVRFTPDGKASNYGRCEKNGRCLFHKWESPCEDYEEQKK